MPGGEVSQGVRGQLTPPPTGQVAVELVAPEAGARTASGWLRLDPRIRREIIVALALLFCYGFLRQVPAWNGYSRYDLVRALVEDGTTRIDRLQENTGDKAFYDGHYYSDKTPGTALLGVPVYWLLTLTSTGSGAGTPDPLTAVQALAFVESGIPTVLVVLLLLRLLRPTVGEGWALLISLGYGLGSIAFPFATMFFGHAASAFFLFAAFYLLWRWHADRGAWRPALAGFLAGWAVIVELSTMLGVLVLLAYALRDSHQTGRRLLQVNWHAPALMVAGAMLPAALFLAYNWVSFGGPFRLGYTNLAAGGFAEGMSRGILGVTWPRPEVLVDLLLARAARFGWHRGSSSRLLACSRRASATYELRSSSAVSSSSHSCCSTPATTCPSVGGRPDRASWHRPCPSRPFSWPWCHARFARLSSSSSRSRSPSSSWPRSRCRTRPRCTWTRLHNSGCRASSIANRRHDAWLRWGLHGFQPLLVLALTLAVAGTALAATVRSGVAADRLSGVLAGLLALLVMAFACRSCCRAPLPSAVDPLRSRSARSRSWR